MVLPWRGARIFLRGHRIVERSQDFSTGTTTILRLIWKLLADKPKGRIELMAFPKSLKLKDFFYFCYSKIH